MRFAVLLIVSRFISNGLFARHLQKTPFSDAERGFAILDITIIVADLRDRGYDAELLVEEDDDVPLAKQTFSLMIWPGLP